MDFQITLKRKKKMTQEIIKNKQRTIAQNNALHLFFEQLAQVLNEEGLEMGTILSKFVLDIPATKSNIKEMIWKPIEQAMFEKKSTKELTTQEINQIYDVINKFFAERGIAIPQFPSLESQSFEKEYN